MSHKPRGNLRPGRYDYTVRKRRRGDRLRKRLRLRPGLKRLDTKPESRPSRRGANSHRHGLGELLARTRSPRSVRWDESKRRGARRRRRSATILYGGQEHLHSEIDCVVKRRAVALAKAGFFTEPKNVCIAK